MLEAYATSFIEQSLVVPLKSKIQAVEREVELAKRKSGVQLSRGLLNIDC